MQEVLVRFEDIRFPYFYGSDCFEEIAKAVAEHGADRAFIISDATVAGLFAERFRTMLDQHLPARLLCMRKERERGKTLAELTYLADLAMDLEICRRSIIISFGGGVPGNLGGLMAALIFRGLPLIHIPTTLIAMHDSVLSLKQAVNFGRAKNSLGTYYAPRAVFADLATLETLSDRQIRSGLVENVKNALAICPKQIPELAALLAEPRLQANHWQRVLELSLAAKRLVMAEDKLERRGALVLEYGHTVGHAIEMLHDGIATDDPITHGEAVGLGMRVAGRVAYARGLLSDVEWKQHEWLLDRASVGRSLPDDLSVEAVIEALRGDNKRGLLATGTNQLPMILLEGLGRPSCSEGLPLVPVYYAEVAEALSDLGQARIAKSFATGLSP